MTDLNKNYRWLDNPNAETIFDEMPRDMLGWHVPPPGSYYRAGYDLRLAMLRIAVIAFWRPAGPLLRKMRLR